MITIKVLQGGYNMTRTQSHKKQLQEELIELENQLDDAKLEKAMIFNQIGVHVSSQKVSIQIKDLEEEIIRLEKKVSELKKQLD